MDWTRYVNVRAWLPVQVPLDENGIPADTLWHYTWAVPNGGGRSKSEAAKLKAEGVKAGAPDLSVMIPAGKWSGLQIEMKARKPHHSYVSRVQQSLHRRLVGVGYCVRVCYGADDAMSAVCEYLGITR